MEDPNPCRQSSNCIIHCFSIAGRILLRQLICPIWFDSSFPYLKVCRQGRLTTITLVRFFADFLSKEKAKHESIRGRIVTEALIDLPLGFNVELRRSTLLYAATSIGVRIQEFLDRPILAALCYFPFRPHVRKVLVFEIGNGVLCSSLLKIQRGNLGITVVASEHSYGCPLVKFVGKKIKRSLGIEIQQYGIEFTLLNASCEQAKNVLCSGELCSVVDVYFLPQKRGVQMLPQVVNMAMLKRLNCRWIRKNIKQCLSKAGQVSFDAVDEVVLVGFSVGIPDVINTLVSLFPGKPLRDDLHPGTFVRERANLLARLSHNETMVISADDIDRVWPKF
ncbi:hypothetical protein HPP92_015103 [Vanilla planifolia]|uniref:Uncharacterized protein n=1 Tax=Vanilla planifolia TaxID=51239 RepID=A0A835UVE1_VANPL|nr:hypothetical protein HPP92_015103 [Vanilla planifolia]